MGCKLVEKIIEIYSYEYGAGKKNKIEGQEVIQKDFFLSMPLYLGMG
jgi:hypothetical protein